ncbi:MAG: N-acetylmuramoyl-L-alanine amidase, partial [Chitinophagaceae bacterium]|nr:N-acetylmuramoyl-L-alanine amidase [Chitinophagaceae bacterium]
KVDPGYPLLIAGNWPGISEAGFAGGIKAVVDTLDLVHEIWLDSAEVIKSLVNGPRFLPLPWRGVLHTTEGSTIEGAIQTFKNTNFWPHFTIEPNTMRVIQHLPLTIGARALSDQATAENAANCIQIEIVGFAAETPTWAPEQLAFIGDVMRQIMDQVPIPKQSGRTFLNQAGVNAHPENRMSVNEWKLFSGWCGHQHVPGESHWDPGAIDIDTLLL